MSFKPVLKNIKTYKGEIEVLTGLHIGAGDVEMHIGGTDNPVIKHPFTNEPYIPGSSLKGKVRSLLELASGLLVYSKGEPLNLDMVNQEKDPEKRKIGENIIKLFGVSGSEQKQTLGPTRISFADAFITEEIKRKFEKGEIVLTEIKAENRIHRIKGTAEHPRFTERVPAGIKFEFTITLKIFEDDDEKELETLLLAGLKLLEFDALGGSGSRGYGRVKIHFNEPEEIKEKFENLDPFKILLMK